MTPSGEGDGDALKSKIELSLVLLPMQVLKLSITKVHIDKTTIEIDDIKMSAVP